MARFPSRLAERHAPGAGSSLLLLAALLALAALWSGAFRGTWSERFAAAGLAQIAGLGLAHYAAALAMGGALHPGLTWPLLAVSGTVAAVARFRGAPREPRPAPKVSLSPWDAASGFFLATLLVPTLFPYIHFDAKAIWACRAYAFAGTGNLHGVLACKLPNYPPLFSILLWLGVGDPLFQGRLLPWLALVLFALFFRARLAVLIGPAASLALLFFVSTVHVWQGAAMYYANVPLMVFLCAGAFLSWGLPGRDSEGPSTAEQIAGALCLSAAVLMRPDGFVYLSVLVGAWVFVRVREGRRLPFAPLAAAAAASLSWMLRPTMLRLPHDFFSADSGGWRSAGLLGTLGTFANGLQGQWLAHKGFGAAFFLLAAALILRWRRVRADDETAFFGLVTLGSLSAVALCYLAIPFLGDAYEAAQPFSGTWREAYLHFIRVGLGRMTVHLYPFAVLYGAGALLEAVQAASTVEPARDGASVEVVAR